MRKYKELCYHKKKLKMKKLGRTKRPHEKSPERNIQVPNTQLVCGFHDVIKIIQCDSIIQQIP